MFSSKPSSLGQIQNSSGGGVTASVIISSGNAIAMKQLLLWEINEGGGENTLFLILAEAYKKNPTIDGMGLLMSTFIAESGDMQVNIDRHERTTVQNAIKNFYSTRRRGVTLMQYRNQRPPSNIFDNVINCVRIDVNDVIARFSVNGGMSVSGTTVSFHKFTVSSDSGMTAGRNLKLKEIRAVAAAAMKMGMSPPQFLMNLNY